MKKSKKINNLKELENLAKEFLNSIKSSSEKATVIALSGDLGSGKTAFVKEAAKYFNVKEEITSPTFVILKSYSINQDGYKFLHHIDAYRLEKADEILKIGWNNLIEDPKNIVFIEWPENVSSVIPKEAFRIEFKFIDEGTRGVFFDMHTD